MNHGRSGARAGGVRTTLPRAVVFDVDGTLVDSERDGHRVAFNAAFAEAGLEDRWDVETYGRLLRIAGGDRRLAAWFESTGRSRDEALALARALHPRKTRIMRELVDEGRIRARPGVADLLDMLDAQGIPVHVATTGTRAWVEPLLDRVFGPRFGTVVTGTEVLRLKPDPAVYEEVLRRTGLRAEQAVAVEDSGNGVRAAVAAGLPCVAVTNDYTRGDDLDGAALVADAFTDAGVGAWFAARFAAGAR